MLAAAMMMSVLPTATFAESVNKTGLEKSATSVGGSMEEPAVPKADLAVSKEKAEALARQYVSIPKEYLLQSSNFSMDLMGNGKQNVWGLDFVKKVNGKNQGSINVRINADSGQLLAFNSYVNNPTAKPTYPLKVERDNAQEIALKFIGNVASPYYKQIKFNSEYGVQLLPPLTGEVRHALRFDRIVNGISYVDNYIELEVDSEGHILRYSLQWDDTIMFPEVKTQLTLEQATEKLRAAANPVLNYVIPYNSQGKIKPLLSYDMQPISVDAVTGEKKEESNDMYYWSGTTSDTAITANPLGEAPKSGTVNEKQAVEAVKAAFKLPANAELSGTNFSENSNGQSGEMESFWNLSWTFKKDGKETGSAYASVDGKTGSIRSFNSYNYNSEVQAGGTKVTLDQASVIAIDTIKAQLPWLTDELYFVKPNPKQYEDRSGNTDSYYFNFIHKIHGAVVEYDNINVAVDARTGDIRNFDAYISSFDYADKGPKMITKAQATAKWLSYYRTQLTYRLVQQYTWNGQPIPLEKYNLMKASGEIKGDEVASKAEAELVYVLVPRVIEESVFLDAETGNWRNRETGDLTQLEKPKALDVEGHWAQRQLELMVAYKALDVVDGKVRPNEAVTRGELIKMLVLARNSGHSLGNFDTAASAKEMASFNDVGMDSSYFLYVESALEQNLIDLGDGSFNPDGKVSRDEMAELIVRALGYNALANYDYIFKATFKDAAQIENKGQSAIVVGLKIMSLTDGKFLPKKQVTRAEASVAFFRYLQSRAELQEAPIRM